MRLLKISANQPTFKTIAFRRSGLSLIVGRAKAGANDSSQKTYNGIGKSLSIYLIHFCLGASKDDKLTAALPGWVFSLEFEHEGMIHSASRNVDNQQIVALDGVELAIDDYTAELGRLAFNLTSPQPSLSFRSLITRFIRPTKFSYVRWEGFEEKEGRNNWETLLRNGYLFGLDPDIIRDKHKVRKEQQITADLAKQINEDKDLADHFASGTDPRIERKDLEDQITKLERHLASFEIAEDYGAVKRDAGATKRRLDDITAELAGLDDRIAIIDASLQLGADLPRQQMIALLEEANVILAGGTKRTLEQLETFHQRLLTDRKQRLGSERDGLAKTRDALLTEQAELSTQRTSQLQYLSHHGALSDHMALSQKLADQRSRLDRIKAWQDLIGHYKDRVHRLKARLSELNLETASYLREFDAGLDRNLDLFRSFSSEFYENKPGGITLTANEGDNQIRFNIKASIDDDSADGIGSVKIFCYDMMILLARHHHHMRFIAHDGRLFGGMDPRQRSILFQQAKLAAETHDLQYIANINEDHLDSIRARLGQPEFDRLFSDAIILELTDDSEAGKLLGVKVKLEYDS